jgi:hypothetical protein
MGRIDSMTVDPERPHELANLAPATTIQWVAEKWQRIDW